MNHRHHQPGIDLNGHTEMDVLVLVDRVVNQCGIQSRMGLQGICSRLEYEIVDGRDGSFPILARCSCCFLEGAVIAVASTSMPSVTCGATDQLALRRSAVVRRIPTRGLISTPGEGRTFVRCLIGGTAFDRTSDVVFGNPAIGAGPGQAGGVDSMAFR